MMFSIATVTKGKVTENFTWDGLALVKRGTTSYVNEPHPGGGAPVASSNGGVMFNDILGTTLGVENAGGYASSSMTAFGDTANCQQPTSNFFTGKPHVDGLGHVFLLRNYRADLGKWPTADPLGYPDGWNQMAYCNGKVISCIDFMGADIYHVVDSEGAIAGAGHSAWIIGDDENGYTVYDYEANGLSGSGVSGSSSDGETRRKDGFGTLQDALNYLNSNREGENKFDKKQKWDTTPEQDAKAKNAADSYIKEDYSLLGHNCYQLGVTMFEFLGIPIDPGPHPNNSFWDNNEKYGAEIINILE